MNMLRAAKRVRVDNEYYASYGNLDVHSLMLRDKPRCQAYAEAFEQGDFAGKVVLDVGAGSGFLAMLVARQGAKHVHAVEANSKMAQVAVGLIKANGLDHAITVHSCPVEKMELSDKVDIIVSEWMGFYLFHESMLDSVLYARDNFLKEGGMIYPEECRLWVCPLDLQCLHDEQRHFTDLYGINFSSVFSPEPMNIEEPDITRGVKAENLFCDAQEFVRLDLRTAQVCDLEVFTKSFDFVTTKAGCFGGVGLWFDCSFPGPTAPCFGDKGGVVLDTAPTAATTHWKQTIVYLGKFCPIPAGELLSFTIEITQMADNRRRYLIDLRT